MNPNDAGTFGTDGSTMGGTDGSSSPDASGPAATFSTLQKQVFSRCGGTICHRHAPFAGSMDLTDASAYTSLLGTDGKGQIASKAPTKLRVKPGDPQNSFLMQKLTNNLLSDEGGPMPKSELATWVELPADLIEDIRSWIAAGAKND